MSSNPQYNVTRLYPFGWSKSGLFAWIITQFQDSAGRVTVSFQVINTIVDRVLDGVTEDYPASSVNEQEGALTAFWKRKHKLICATLARHGIAQQRITLVRLPYERQGDKIDVYTKPDSTAPNTKRLSLLCRSQKMGEKRIAMLHPVEAPDGVRTPYPIGAIPNPAGDRLLVLVALAIPGGEGSPETVSFLPVGCNLSKDFSPVQKGGCQ